MHKDRIAQSQNSATPHPPQNRTKTTKTNKNRTKQNKQTNRAHFKTRLPPAARPSNNTLFVSSSNALSQGSSPITSSLQNMHGRHDLSLKNVTDNARQIGGNPKWACGREKDSQVVEPMRQGQVFSRSAAKTKRKYTSWPLHESKEWSSLTLKCNQMKCGRLRLFLLSKIKKISKKLNSSCVVFNHCTTKINRWAPLSRSFRSFLLVSNSISSSSSISNSRSSSSITEWCVFCVCLFAASAPSATSSGNLSTAVPSSGK